MGLMEVSASMRIVTASLPSFRRSSRTSAQSSDFGSPSLSVALPWLLLGAALAVGCKSKAAASPDGGTATTLDNCVPNVASSPGTAAAINSGQSYQNKVCYEGTSNWYSITVPSGHTLLDVTAGYPGSVQTSVALDVKVFYKTDSTTLTQVQDLLAPAQSDAGVASVHTTLQVLQAGEYFIQVADAHNVNFDASNAYTIEVASAVDPDSHEPNDSPTAAKAPDSSPGYLAYLGDLDVFKTSVANAGDLLTLSIDNPATAHASINYQVTSTKGAVVAEGSAPPAAKALSTALVSGGPGDYYVTLSYPTGAVPDRTSAGAYTLSFGSAANPDSTNNHTIATASCPGGGAGPCSMAFAGTAVTLPSQTSFIAVPGQRDFYRVDVTSGAPLVLQIDVGSAASSTPVQYAVDLLTPELGAACQADADCNALDMACSSATDCEMSHACMTGVRSGFCPNSGVACSLCQGSGVCIPGASAGAPGVCAIPQYLSAFSASGKVVGGSSVSTAQPLFIAGPYYVVVHDAHYTNVDLKNPYSLSLRMVPEPDVNDQSTVASQRNNFYDPYPSSTNDLKPNKARAIDITAQVKAGQPVTGYISYQTDDDWFSFEHPCPGQDCGIQFQWVQPGPSPAHIAFFVLNEDLSIHESFGYAGTTTALTAPATSTFANQDCTQCSFASATATGGSGDAGAPYRYYVRVADVSETHWDYGSTGQYSFTVTSITPGCPAACAQAPSGICGCYCTTTGTCPSPTL